jgi:hypothetical protein
MRPMQTVKVTHAQQRGAEVPGDFFEFVKNFHFLCGAGALARNGYIRLAVADTKSSTPADLSGCIRSPVSYPRAWAPAPHNLNLKLQFHSVVGKPHVWWQ